MLRPKAIGVKPLDDYKLYVTFSNNEKKIFDVKPYLEMQFFHNLKDPTLFKSVKTEGLSIEWATGEDICPDELYYNSVSTE